MKYPADVIEVTQEDIDAGCKDIIEPGGCPIALALIKAGYTGVEVWYDDFYFTTPGGAKPFEHLPWTLEITQWQQGGIEKERKPFEFSLNELRQKAGKSVEEE
jgi:hypothetical protein